MADKLNNISYIIVKNTLVLVEENVAVFLL